MDIPESHLQLILKANIHSASLHKTGCMKSCIVYVGLHTIIFYATKLAIM